MRKRENNRLPHFPRTEQRPSFVAAPQHKTRCTHDAGREKVIHPSSSLCANIQRGKRIREYFEAIDREKPAENAFLESSPKNNHIIFFVHGDPPISNHKPNPNPRVSRK